ncbi:ABC transporter ATP-binding protein/permease [Lachnospiraceae bacterium ZAX-1]
MSNQKPIMGGNMGVAKKPKNMKATMLRFMKYMKKSTYLIVLTVITAIIGTVMQVWSPKMLGSATTVIFEGIQNSAGIDFAQLGTILLWVACLYIGYCLTDFLGQRFMVLTAQKTTYAMRNDLKAKMAKVPVSYFDKHPSGELMSVAANDIDNIITNLQQSLTALIANVILIVGFPIMMLSISPLLTLIACVSIPGSIFIMKLYTPLTKKNNMAYFKSLGLLNTQIEESYQGFEVLKNFNGKKQAVEDFEKINDSMIGTGWRARFFGGLTMPTMNLLRNVVYIFIAVVGAVNVVGGKILIGNMQAFLQYSNQFSTPLSQIGQAWSNIISMIASAERVFDMLDAEEMPEYEKAFVDKKETTKVTFDHVQFGYTNELLMTDFNMEVTSGQMIAIVGHTGAGKTTLINLLERFYDISGGSIRIDGKDIRNTSRENLRKRIGMVLQDTWLFSGTIYDNIKYGNETATDEQIYAAAKAAFVDEFVQKLPDGYNTVLSEDAGNISQGQRQLITIARAFVSNPEILILDEATSNVDSCTELVIQSAMKRLLKGRTSFVVAHRLSTIYDADRIIVMDRGDVVETGNHKELLTLNGVYADIYNSQFAGNAA